jgi:hypothetical protein
MVSAFGVVLVLAGVRLGTVVALRVRFGRSGVALDSVARLGVRSDR